MKETEGLIADEFFAKLGAFEAAVLVDIIWVMSGCVCMMSSTELPTEPGSNRLSLVRVGSFFLGDCSVGCCSDCYYCVMESSFEYWF